MDSLTQLLTDGEIERALVAALDLSTKHNGQRTDDLRILLSRFRVAERDAELGVLDQRSFDSLRAQLTRAALRLVRELGLNSHPCAKPATATLSSAGRAQPQPRGCREVFISYKWGGESEALAERVEQILASDDITIVRDKRALGFKADIDRFMDRLSDGFAVVCILSDGYLRSHNCMRELVRLMQHADGEARAFPLVLSDANVYEPPIRLRYVELWQERLRGLNTQIRELQSQEGLETARAEIDLYAQIARSIDPLTGWLKRTNALPIETHHATDFDALRRALAERLGLEARAINR